MFRLTVNPFVTMFLVSVVITGNSSTLIAQPFTAAEDDALWKKLDWNPDGWLDGKELDGGWIRFDSDKNGEVTRKEFIAGRAAERMRTPSPSSDDVDTGASKTAKAPKPASDVKRKTAGKRVSKQPVQKPVRTASQGTTPVPRVARRAGRVSGSVSAAPGVRLGVVTVDVGGFEDGKLATGYNGTLYDTVTKTVKLNGGGVYSVPVPPGAYRATAYSTYRFNGQTYNFPLELTDNPTYDYKSIELEKLRGGILRNFVLKLSGVKKGYSEGTAGHTESTYIFAYYGGRVDLDADTADSPAIGATTAPPSLRALYPPTSRVLVTLVPQALVDGSRGTPVQIDLPLGDSGKWTFNQRGVVPGTYSATAQLRTSSGEIVPVRLSTQGPRWIAAESKNVMDWKSSVTFTFTPFNAGPAPHMGVNAVRLFLGPAS